MARRTFNCYLSKKSLEKTINQLKQYQKEFEDKNEEFVRRLADLGLPIIEDNISMAQGDSDKQHHTYIKLTSLKGYSEARVVVEGKDLLFIEFGAGVHYNVPAGSSPHPKGEEFGYTIGSYGKGLGENDSWWYTDSTGVSRQSQGTQATMPLYKASTEMRLKIRKIAKEVFGG